MYVGTAWAGDGTDVAWGRTMRHTTWHGALVVHSLRGYRGDRIWAPGSVHFTAIELGTVLSG